MTEQFHWNDEEFLSNKILRCKCGNEVVRGEVGINRNHKQVFRKLMNDIMKGTIIKNGSSDHEDWSILCSKCQKEEKNAKRN